MWRGALKYFIGKRGSHTKKRPFPVSKPIITTFHTWFCGHPETPNQKKKKQESLIHLCCWVWVCACWDDKARVRRYRLLSHLIHNETCYFHSCVCVREWEREREWWKFSVKLVLMGDLDWKLLPLTQHWGKIKMKSWHGKIWIPSVPHSLYIYLVFALPWDDKCVCVCGDYCQNSIPARVNCGRSVW